VVPRQGESAEDDYGEERAKIETFPAPTAIQLKLEERRVRLHKLNTSRHEDA
jgi:hypothetical protein